MIMLDENSLCLNWDEPEVLNRHMKITTPVKRISEGEDVVILFNSRIDGTRWQIYHELSIRWHIHLQF